MRRAVAWATFLAVALTPVVLVGAVVWAEVTR